MNRFSGFDGFDRSDDFSDVVKKFSKKRKKGFWITLTVIVLAVVALVSSYDLIMEYWQIQEIGENYTSVFWTNLWARVLTQGIGFLLVFLVLWLNLSLLKRFALVKAFDFSVLKKRWPYLIGSLVLSLAVSGFVGGNLYQKLLMALNSQSFGVTDPLFSQDVGYYIFLRPFLMSVADGAKTLVLLLLLIVAVCYFIIFVKKGHRSLKDVISSEKGPLFHVLLLAICYFLLSVLSYKFSAEGVLFSSFGSQNDIFGAGYIEANIWRQYYRFAPLVVLLTVALILFFLYRKKYIPAVCSVLVVPVVFILVSLVSVAVDSLVVSPNERNLQTPYIAYNMEATSQAYGLSKLSETEFVPRYDLTLQTVEEDDTWLAGTRIADFGATLTGYNQLQFLRKYYTFNDVDVVPYELDGKLNVVFLAAREMNKENLDPSAKSYANQMFRYTHGFGVVASPVNRVTAEGQPEFLIKDIPPKATGGMPEVTQPRIYYGELTNDYVIVGGDNQELDYSEGLQDVQFTYDGDGGLKLNLLNRLLFSWHYKDYRMLVSGNIDADSKLLLNRNVLERVKKAAPFLTFDSDPYLVVSDDGQLFWIINAYTASGDYPYAQPYENVNYIRNSIMVTVDAYTGEVLFYLTDDTDPLARAYRSMYPQLFAEDDMPAEIASHVRVPELLFKIQAQMYQKYHVKDAGQFYDRADVWDIAREKYQDNEIAVEPYYNIMEIDGQDEMVLMLPFVVQGKHNMVGLLVKRNAPEHYGELLLYRFPKNETVYGPLQVENRIDNDPDISREMTLWGQGGSSVIRGNLLVVPYRNSLLYVEPIYITSQNNASLPELKRIVVAYGDAVAMKPTLGEALAAVFAEGAAVPEAPEGEVSGEPSGGEVVLAPTDSELEGLEAAIQDVLSSYDAFRQSTQNGDWQAMGSHMEQLEEDMERLRQQNAQ